jgi:hypothetical protein
MASHSSLHLHIIHTFRYLISGTFYSGIYLPFVICDSLIGEECNSRRLVLILNTYGFSTQISLQFISFILH